MEDARFRAWVIGLSSLLAVLVVLFFVVLLSGDSRAPGDTVAATTSSARSTGTEATTTTATTTTAPSTTSAPTTVAPTTTAPTTLPPTTGAGACSGLPGEPTPGSSATFAAGDFDGDGAMDELIGHQDTSGAWWVQMALSYGYATETAVPGPAVARGAQDFGSTGQAVGFAEVDFGASTTIISFFYLPGCEVFEATVEGGAAARFPVGGGVSHLDGLRCTADGFVATSATTSDGTTWEYSETTYDWVAGLGEFHAVASSIQMLTSPDDDAVIFAAGDFACPA